MKLNGVALSIAERLDTVNAQRKEWLNACHFYANLQSMKATIDAAGRTVVPMPLDIRAGDGRLEIEIAPTPMPLKKRGKGVVAVPDSALPALTAQQVRDTLERVRR